MPIPFSCPHCQLETLVDDEFAGQSGACAGCGKPITVPFVSSSEPLGADEVVVGIPHRRQSITTISLVVVGAILAGGAALTVSLTLLFPAVGAVVSAEQKHRCSTNLEKIAQAMKLYEAEHGSLPPAYVADGSGQPMHSWRVLLLPFLGKGELYAQYDLTRPWDSRENMLLAKKMPAVYACPSDPDALTLGESNYMVIVGPETLFPGREARSTSHVTDEPDTTFCVVETPCHGATWTQPGDLRLDSMQFVVNGGFGKEIGSQHFEGAYALMADGQVRFLSDLLHADYLAAMATIQGDESIPRDAVDSLGGWR